MRATVLLFALVITSCGQTRPQGGIQTNQDTTWTAGDQDLSAANSLRLKTGSGAPPPAACANAKHVGRIYVRSDALTPNASLFLCSNTAEAKFTWELVQRAAGGSAGGPARTSVGLAGDGSAENPLKIDSASGVVARLVFTDSSEAGNISNASCSRMRTIPAAGVTPADVIAVGNPVYGAGGLFAVAQPGQNEIFYQVCNLSGSGQRVGSKQYTFFVLKSF